VSGFGTRNMFRLCRSSGHHGPDPLSLFEHLLADRATASTTRCVRDGRRIASSAKTPPPTVTRYCGRNGIDRAEGEDFGSVTGFFSSPRRPDSLPLRTCPRTSSEQPQQLPQDFDPRDKLHRHCLIAKLAKPKAPLRLPHSLV